MKKVNIDVNGINVGVIEVSECNTDKEVGCYGFKLLREQSRVGL